VRRLLLPSLVLALLALGEAAADAATPPYGSFRTPSGNIVCIWGIDDGPYPPFIRCDIRSGLVPFPARPRGCPRDSDYGQGLQLLAVPRAGERGKGVATVVCAGDTALGPGAPALAYGSTFRRGGLSCTSVRSGLTCRNLAGRGFFLSRERWRIF
jgi:hypothetical protein